MSARSKSRVLASVGLATLLACVQERDNAAIRQFGEAYVLARKALGEAEVSSYVVVVNSKDVTGQDDYWSYLTRALESHDPAENITAAKSALLAYSSRTEPFQEQLAGNIESLHRSVLALLEAANRIHDPPLRAAASSVAEGLAKAHQNLQQMNVNIGRRFQLQLAILEELRNGQNRAHLLLARRHQAQEVADLSTLIDKARLEEQQAANESAQNYARLRGLTNLPLPDALAERRPEGQRH